MRFDQPPTINKKNKKYISLRLQVALGVALPVLILLISSSFAHYRREYRVWDQQIKLSAAQLGETIILGLQHAMLTKEPDHIERILQDINQMENFQLVQLIGLNGNLIASSEINFQPNIYNTNELGCVECHQVAADARPRTMELVQTSNLLRVSTPIENSSSCQQCHDHKQTHLGVLLIDISLLEIQTHALEDIKINLIITIGSTLLVVLVVYFLIHFVVVRRIENFRQPITEFSSGNFSARIPTKTKNFDELSELAETFNLMADQQEKYAIEQEQQHELKQIAIVEERERLARELHDGLAQILGYINTEVMAIRLLLNNQKIETAKKHLSILEETSRDFFVDVREIILGLKMTGGNGDLAKLIENYTFQFSRLSKLEVKYLSTLSPQFLSLRAETELHLLRIVQEALSNVRKHANATHVTVNLSAHDHILELSIKDNGKGFDLKGAPLEEFSKFGLSMMLERAEAIGASFHLNSKPNLGTQVIIRMALDGE